MIKATLKKRFSWWGQTLAASNAHELDRRGVNTQLQQKQLFMHYKTLLDEGKPLPRIADVGFRVFSQTDEDGILLYLFSLIGFTNRLCFDVAFASPFGANTTNLLVNHGFSGVLVCGKIDEQKLSEQFFAQDPEAKLFPPRVVTTWITAENINDVALHHGLSGSIDVFSLDIDGVDYWLWQALTVVQPRVVVVEFQSAWPADHAVTVPYDPAFDRLKFHPSYFGASLQAFTLLAQRKGYRLVACNSRGFNAFFVRNDVISEAALPTMSVEQGLVSAYVRDAQTRLLPEIKGFPWIEVEGDHGSGSIPVNEPLLDGNEKKYLLECIDSGWISSDGPFVQQFENAVAARVDRKHGVAVCNGSVALDLAVQALGIGPGDEVIMPTLTIISCAAAVVRVGATPVLVDADPATWTMDVLQLEQKITSKTKAIMVVHLYGLPVDMDPVLALASRYNLTIIEDAAEAIGLRYKGHPCGSFGTISTLSFYANKHLTTGEGGMLLTNDDALAERCRLLRNLCFKPEQRYLHDELGTNARFTNLQAAVGLAQLEQLDRFLQRKKTMGAFYTAALRDITQLQLPVAQCVYAANDYWVYGIVDTAQPAKVLQDYLAQHGIATRPFFWPLHEQPVFKKMGLFVDQHFPVAQFLARHGCYLPSGLALTPEQMQRVVSVVIDFYS